MSFWDHLNYSKLPSKKFKSISGQLQNKTILIWAFKSSKGRRKSSESS